MAKKHNSHRFEGIASDFRQFINRGSIIDLATGIIIGSAFTAIVNSLVNDIVMPLISDLIEVDLTTAKVVLKEPVLDEEGKEIVSGLYLRYGAFIQSVINFFVIALAIFVAVKTVNWIRKSYVRSQIKFIKNLKRKHPEFFDEDDEPGTRVYEKLKAKHPEYFKDEINEEIEKKKAQINKESNPIVINNSLLLRLNENLEKLNESQAKKDNDNQN